MTGALLIVIGVLNPHHLPTVIGLVSFMAIFHEAGNGLILPWFQKQTT